MTDRYHQNPQNNNNGTPPLYERLQDREPMRNSELRVEIPYFTGGLKPEEFHDWINTGEKFFELKKVPPDKRVLLVIIRLRDRIAAWWQSYKFHRYLDGLPPLNNWCDLKSEMTSKFLPLNYRQSENRDCQPRQDSKSFTYISPHHHYYNISSNTVSPSPHLQRRDNYFKYLNCFPHGSKEENFNREDEEINPFHDNKSLVTCEQDDRHQPHTPPSSCSQQVNQKATTSVEECQEEPNELVDRLVAVEEIQKPDDEENVNTLTDELKLETETVENLSNFEEDFVGDFSNS